MYPGRNCQSGGLRHTKSVIYVLTANKPVYKRPGRAETCMVIPLVPCPSLPLFCHTINLHIIRHCGLMGMSPSGILRIPETKTVMQPEGMPLKVKQWLPILKELLEVQAHIGFLNGQRARTFGSTEPGSTGGLQSPSPNA